MTKLRGALLTLGAVVGVACLFVAVAGLVFDVKPLVFRSGSMGPTIPAGSLALARTVEAHDLGKGDVVSVLTLERARVTHRIVGIDAASNGKRDLTLQGDANSTPDVEIYTVAEADRVFVSLPGAGYVVSWLGSPIGLVALGAAAAGVLILGFGSRRGNDGPTDRRVATVIATPVAAAMALVHVTSGTGASYQDVAVLTGGALGAYTVPKPPITRCDVSGSVLGQKTATITFTATPLPHSGNQTWLDYDAVAMPGNAGLPIAGSGATRTVTFSSGLLGTLLNRTYNIQITGKLPNPNQQWTSISSTQPVTVTLLGLGMTCGTDS